jgi:transposase-like protein
LPSARWQRCVVHFERNVLAHVPAADVAEVASDLKAIFSVHRAESAAALAEAFAQRYQKRFARAVATLKGGLADALTFLAFPSSHHRLLRSTNGLERLFGEVKRRTRVVGVFPNEASATNLCSAVMLRASEEWALRRYLDMAPLQAMNTKTEAEG